LGLLPLLAVLAIVIIGVIIYKAFGTKAARTGVLKLYGHRPAMYLLYNKKGAKKKRVHYNEKFSAPQTFNRVVSQAGVVVPLFGNENSPEMITEIGAAINKKEKILTVNITEIPNQTDLDAVMVENAHITSLKRRISILAQERNLDIDFEAVVTHDLSSTIAELSDQAECDWLVVAWKGKAHSGILVNNPIGWLMTHLNSDFALFKDNGVRYIGKVLLALRPGRKDKNFVAIADRICQFYGATLTLLHIVPEDYPEDELIAMKDNANNILAKATSKSSVNIHRSNDSKLAIANISARYDLLILGTPEKESWAKVLFGAKDKFTDTSTCSVLRLTMKD